MIIYDKNNERGHFQTAYFIVLAGTGPEIGDPRLGNRSSAVSEAILAHGPERPVECGSGTLLSLVLSIRVLL
jgi:hypothetical protein